MKSCYTQFLPTGGGILFHRIPILGLLLVGLVLLRLGGEQLLLDVLKLVPDLVDLTDLQAVYLVGHAVLANFKRDVLTFQLTGHAAGEVGQAGAGHLDGIALIGITDLAL